MCHKNNPKYLLVSQIALADNQANGTAKSSSAIVNTLPLCPRNNDIAAFRSHQICLSFFEYGIDLIPSCTSKGNLNKTGSQGDVPAGSMTTSKIICLFDVSSDKCLVSICTQLESGTICIR